MCWTQRERFSVSRLVWRALGAKRAHGIAGAEGTPQNAVGHQLPDPLAVQHVALAPADLLRHPRRHEHHLEVGALQRLDRGRFHLGQRCCPMTAVLDGERIDSGNGKPYACQES